MRRNQGPHGQIRIYSAPTTRLRIQQEFGLNHRYVDVFDYVIEVMNTTRYIGPYVYITRKQLADKFNVKPPTAKVWLRDLRRSGVLVEIERGTIRGTVKRASKFGITGLQVTTAKGTRTLPHPGQLARRARKAPRHQGRRPNPAIGA